MTNNTSDRTFMQTQNDRQHTNPADFAARPSETEPASADTKKTGNPTRK
ncbi:hypothetical protein [Chelonobacter oris]|nr:hypothetical protein [Chelonobacter oris]